MKRAKSLFLALALALTLAPTALLADSPAYGSELWLRDTPLQQGVTYSENIFWSDTYQGPRHEYYFTYTPGETTPVRPVVAWGESVCGRLTTSAAARAYEAEGWRVVGAINGDFFSPGTGCPLGMVVSQGRLLCGSDHVVGVHPDDQDTYYAVGFRADGTVVMGEPKLSISAVRDATGETIPLAGVNRPQLETLYATLITYDYRTDRTTGPLANGTSVVTTVVDGAAAIGGRLTLRVEKVVEGNTPLALEENQAILSISAGGAAEHRALLQSLLPGETVTVSFGSLDTENDWSQVTEAVGALHLLVKNGTAQGGFAAGAAPRTAVGVKANGELVLYTIDGRQKSVSAGSTLNVLAMRMAELGCVTALCLDGGGSTTAVAALPGEETARVLNSPSDGTERMDPNHILLLAPGTPSGIPGAVYFEALEPAVLHGHTVKLTAGLLDTNYFPMEGEVNFEASAGTVENGAFTAPDTAGSVTITASWGEASAQRTIQVLDGPDTFAVTRDGRTVTALTIMAGDTAQLGVSASHRRRPLDAAFGDFTWTVDPSLGTIDENGVFTANRPGGQGKIAITWGDFSASLPLTVETDLPFADMEGHWGTEYVADLYRRGLFTGVEEKGVLYAYPDRAITRQEFAVLLARYLEVDTAAYEAYEVPFADMDSVPAWAAGSARAMYAMGLVTGSEVDGELRFDPRGTLTRAQAVTMLGRLLSTRGFQAEETNLSAFADAEEIPDYALDHFRTLVSLGVVAGSDGKLDPNGPMTRAAVCKVLDTLPQQGAPDTGGAPVNDETSDQTPETEAP